MYLSSGLKQMPVTVSVWPAKGCPNDCHFVVSYMRTTACSGADALQAVAARSRLLDTATVIV